MVKKVIAFQKLLSSMRGNNNGVGIKICILMLVLFGLMFINGSIGFRFSARLNFYVLMLFLCGYQMASARKSLCRNLPVSDKFVVLNCIVVMPIWISLVVILVISLIAITLFFISNLSSGMDTNFFEALFYEIMSLRGAINWYGNIWIFLVAATVWFVFCAAVFSRNRLFKIISLIVVVGMFIVFEAIMVKNVREIGYYGGIRASDIVYFIPEYPLVISMFVITIISGILSYKYCVKMLRYDTKGQRTVKNDETKMISEYNEIAKNNLSGDFYISKKSVFWFATIITTVVFVFLMFDVLGIFEHVDESDKIEQITTNINDYNNWDMNDEFGWSYSNTSTFVFPEEIDSKNVVSYNAAKYGIKDQNLDKAHRILVQNFSKEEFEAERKRIARISYESPVDGKVNYILHDTKHFSNEAYIAIYDNDALYEYAIMDEEKLQITYLYCYFEKPGIVFKDYDVFPVWTEPVISIENANTDLKGYDIRSFYDEENGWYEIMDED